jgi:K+-transporting ATPase KdpF subunit
MSVAHAGELIVALLLLIYLVVALLKPEIFQ